MSEQRITLHDVPIDPTPVPGLAAALAAAMDALGDVLTERDLQYAPPDRFGDDLTALADELRSVLDTVCTRALVAERGAGACPDVRTDWAESAFHRAAAVYRRECSWDFTPDESGVWVCAFAPTAYESVGCDDERDWRVRGDLIGFVILHDRDGDGDPDSVAHLWTASGWRRRGIARALHAIATERFPVCGVEGR